METKQDDPFQAKHTKVKPSATESNVSRPSSGLARGIQITEYQDARFNPEPARIDESVNLLEGYLAPQKLRALTGVDDLATVHFLEMKVDSRETSLGNFGMHLANLTQLKLSNSIIVSMRDLGSSLNNLRILWMARCGTEDLDGVSAMVNLQELYLAYNEISDLSPCGMLENLQILDIEGNNISDISQLTFLMLCQKLSTLTLEGNPVCVAASPSEADLEYNYRQTVKTLIPHLETLDDEPLLEQELVEARSTPSVFDEDWKLLDELMTECPVTFMEESLETGGRPGTSARPPTGTAYRPGSALKPYSASGFRPGSSQAGRSSSGRPGSSCSWTGSTGSGNLNSVTLPDDDLDAACDLTSGSIVCGSVSRALRNRRQKSNDVSAEQTEQLLSKFGHKPEHTFDTQLEDDETIRQLSEELKQWKEGHRRRVEEIEKTKAPQILKIEYDEASGVSSDADSDDLLGAEGECVDRMDPTDGCSGASDADQFFTRHVPPTSAKQRTRIYSPRTIDSGIGSLQSLQSAHHTPDESVEIEEDELEPFESRIDSMSLGRSFSSTLPGSEERQRYGGLSSVYDPAPPSSMVRKYAEPLRPISGPVVTARRKFRLESQVDKSQPKIIDPVHPVIRSSVHSPEGRISDAPRAGTSRAALAHPPTTPPALIASQLRRGLLSSVPLLPSKYNK